MRFVDTPAPIRRATPATMISQTSVEIGAKDSAFGVGVISTNERVGSVEVFAMEPDAAIRFVF